MGFFATHCTRGQPVLACAASALLGAACGYLAHEWAGRRVRALADKPAAAAPEDKDVERQVDSALKLLHQAGRLWAGHGDIALSFNGGKDATVLLHLVRLYAMKQQGTPRAEWRARLKSPEAKWPANIRCFFVLQDDEFDDVVGFVESVTKELGIPLDVVKVDMSTTCPNARLRDAVTKYTVENNIKVFVDGSRSTDPNASYMKSFTASSDDWPPFMRVAPVLHWSYGDVWRFLRQYDLPYCKLYDEGYTSLGSTWSTSANPLLRRADGSYQPAHALLDETAERSGRRTG